MNPVFVLAGLGAATFAALASRGRKLPPGQNPFDAFPPGVDPHPLGTELVTASSKRRYAVTHFAHFDGRVYYVAQTKGDVDWISYFVQPTGARALWAANADHLEEIETMKRDFELPAGGLQ
jgi:hypothetical protein